MRDRQSIKDNIGEPETMLSKLSLGLIWGDDINDELQADLPKISSR